MGFGGFKSLGFVGFKGFRSLGFVGFRGFRSLGFVGVRNRVYRFRGSSSGLALRVWGCGDF